MPTLYQTTHPYTIEILPAGAYYMRMEADLVHEILFAMWIVIFCMMAVSVVCKTRYHSKTEGEPSANRLSLAEDNGDPVHRSWGQSLKVGELRIHPVEPKGPAKVLQHPRSLPFLRATSKNTSNFQGEVYRVEQAGKVFTVYDKHNRLN